MSSTALAKKRKKLFRLQKGICAYCGCKTIKKLKPHHPRKLKVRVFTLDHVIPRSKGGTNRWENIVGACFECNQKKADILM